MPAPSGAHDVGRRRSRRAAGRAARANLDARRLAIGALRDRYGDDRGYDAEAAPTERAAAALRWQQP